jgi:hypothetical protein
MAHLSGGVRGWSDVRNVARRGFDDGIVCLATIEVIERSNRPSVINPLHDAKASLAARTLVECRVNSTSSVFGSCFCSRVA